MASTSSTTVAVKADTSHLIRVARIIEKHFGALADDLEQLRDGAPGSPCDGDLPGWECDLLVHHAVEDRMRADAGLPPRSEIWDYCQWGRHSKCETEPCACPKHADDAEMCWGDLRRIEVRT